MVANLLAMSEVLGEVSLIIPSPIGKGSSAMVTSFERTSFERRRKNK
jgi:hypothetical protein